MPSPLSQRLLQLADQRCTTRRVVGQAGGARELRGIDLAAAREELAQHVPELVFGARRARRPDRLVATSAASQPWSRRCAIYASRRDWPRLRLPAVRPSRTCAGRERPVQEGPAWRCSTTTPSTAPVGAARRARPDRRGSCSALAVALVGCRARACCPTPVRDRAARPSTTRSARQEHDGKEVPLISIDGAETYPTDGALDLLTVQRRGQPRAARRPGSRSLGAWFDPSRAVLPIDAVFPPGRPPSERNAGERRDDGRLAAGGDRGRAHRARLRLPARRHRRAASSTTPRPTGVLEEGDVILDGRTARPVTDVDELRAAIADERRRRRPSSSLVVRDGDEQTVAVTPVERRRRAAVLIGVDAAHGLRLPDRRRRSSSTTSAARARA